MALNQVLLRVFKIVTDFYYDDRWGVEPLTSIESAFSTVDAVTDMLGILTQGEKAQGPPEVWKKDENGNWAKHKNPNCEGKEPWKNPDLLGVTFNLDKLLVQIKEGRRTDLKAEIEAIVKSDSLSPGHAAKLKGRLFFLTCSLFGRVGRAFMRPLSERQYEFTPRKGKNWNTPHVLNDAIRDALQSWLLILERGRPRAVREIRRGPADAVVFTDGYAPEPSDPAGSRERVGAVMGAWWRESPVAISLIVPDHLIKMWIPRKNQIALVEIFGAVLALSHFGPELAGKRLIMLIDSECALDALIKGQSKFSDVIKLVKVFWELVADFHLDVYLDKVSTDANPSDGVSRGKIKEAISLGWKIEAAKFDQRLEVKRHQT